MTRLIIFANGIVPNEAAARGCLQPGDRLVAADGGTNLALALGVIPSLVIGDLDSLTPENRQRLEEKNVEIRRFSRDKDETDLELALDYARTTGLLEVLIIGGLGGRIDQTLGNLSLLADPWLAPLDVRMDDGVEEVFYVRERSELHGRPGEIVSLIPWGGEVSGVRTKGLRWPLRGETLLPDRTRGISNEMVEESASIEIATGLLMCVHRRSPPGAEPKALPNASG